MRNIKSKIVLMGILAIVLCSKSPVLAQSNFDMDKLYNIKGLEDLGNLKELQNFNPLDSTHTDQILNTMANKTFNGSNMSNNNFSSRNIANCTFNNTTANNTDFSKANMMNAEVNNSNFSNSNFNNTNFHNCNFNNVNFSNANLMNADMTNADLNSVNLSGAILYNTVFTNTDFYNTTFINAIVNHNNSTNSRKMTNQEITALTRYPESVKQELLELNNRYNNVGIIISKDADQI